MRGQNGIFFFDNARQTFNTLVTNPELLKGITQQEISFITNNGYFPSSLITRIGQTLGSQEKFLSIVSSQTTANTKTWYGVTPTGLVKIGTAADVSQAAASENSRLKGDFDAAA